jgi:hypothetical protein
MGNLHASESLNSLMEREWIVTFYWNPALSMNTSIASKYILTFYLIPVLPGFETFVFLNFELPNLRAQT